jgi:Fe2+ or Zn2+ uptake regulation protein
MIDILRLVQGARDNLLPYLCGRVLIDIPAAALAATLATAQAATGYQLTRSGLTLPGRCPSCQ